MGPDPTHSLNIFDLSIQVELKNEIWSLYLREKTVSDREADLGELPRALFIKGNDKIIEPV
jgi:hypothetical protein